MGKLVSNDEACVLTIQASEASEECLEAAKAISTKDLSRAVVFASRAKHRLSTLIESINETRDRLAENGQS